LHGVWDTLDLLLEGPIPWFAWRDWRWVETVMIAEMAPHLLAEIRAVLHTESQR
jgi:hypothetical protein